jgi:hypothetical protein
MQDTIDPPMNFAGVSAVPWGGTCIVQMQDIAATYSMQDVSVA